MLKKLLLHAIPFLVPFVAYALYVIATKRAAKQGYNWRESPWYWLTVTGLVLFILSLMLGADVFWSNTGDTYVPAQLENGEVVPGQFRSEDPDGTRD